MFTSKKNLIFALLLALVLLFAVAPSGEVMAAEITVCSSGCNYSSIQAAINNANPGDTITVAAGTYVEVGQIVINKNLSIVGADKVTTIIKPAQDTGSSGDSKGWFLVQNGVTFNLSNVTLDGDGYKVHQAIRSLGAGIINNNIIKNIKYSQYVGLGIVVMGNSNMTFSNNTFSNIERIGMQAFGSGVTDAVISGNTYTGKGAGDWLDYGVEIGGGAKATITGNTITNCKGVALTDGSTSAGILITTYYGAGTNATIVNNNLTDNTTGIAVGYNELDTSSVTATGNTFASNDEQIFATAVGLFNVAATLAANTFDRAVTVNHPDASLLPVIWSNIQDGIDAAATGDTINVAAGTYAENVDVTKPVTLLGPNAGTPGYGTRVAEAIIQGTNASWVSLYVEPNVPGVTIDGFKFDGANLTPDGYVVGVAGDSSNLTVKNNVFVNHNDIAIMTSGVYYDNGWKYDKWLTDILIKDNLITNSTLSTSVYNFGIYLQSSLGSVTGNMVTNMRNGIQVQPYWNTPDGGTISGNTFEAYRTGIYFNYTQNATANWLFENNNVSGIAYPAGLTADRFNAIRVETMSAGNAVFEANSILLGSTNAIEKYQYFENNVTGGTRDASPNWWGSITGPAAGQVVGDVTYSPWCGDEDCSFLVSKNAQGELILEGEIKATGGITIDEPGTTILLKNGTVIQNNSPCFVVNADHTTIKAESIGGAVCKPTNDSNGIDVNAGVKDLTIQGIEFDGSTGEDGIHFAGGITDLVIVDNWFHDFTGDGIEFTAQPAGIINIQGNLFQNNAELGIDAGTYTVDAEYNSWGDKEGPAGTNGDGASAGVITTPYTHVDLYIDSPDVASNGQVASGKNVTYTVYGNFVNTLGVDFKLDYPDNLTLVETANSTTFPEIAVIDTTTNPGTIHFHGMAAGYTPVNGTYPIFTATFTTGTVGTDGTLNLDETSDAFAMEGYESSTNIYAAELVDYPVNIVTMPTISSDDIQGYYLTGEPRDFHVSVSNPPTGGTFDNSIYYVFTIANAVLDDLNSLTCKFDGSTDTPISMTQQGTDLVGRVGYGSAGFPMPPGFSTTTTCTAKFATAKNYGFTVDMVDGASTPADFKLATLADIANVYNKPALTSVDLDGPYQATIPQNFTLNVNNMSDMGAGVTFEVHFNFPTGTVVEYDGTAYTCGETTGCLIPVTLAAGSNPLTFSVTFPGAFSGNITATLYDTAWDPDRALASLTTSVTAYGNVVSITGTVSMQGRTFRGGVPMTLTGTLGFGPFNATSINQISDNITFTNVAAGVYTITTSQPRYLNVIADLGKTIDVTLKTAITALELKGGNAVWTDNVINVDDASAVGTNYGSLGDINADVNFSGKVDIFDLALVGGNYTLTSTVAYESWTP